MLLVSGVPTLFAQEELKIMQLNVHGFEPDFNTVPYSEFFKECDADIICFNECENRTSRQQKNGKYRDLVYEIAGKLNMFSLFGFSYNVNNKTEQYPIEKDKFCSRELYGNAILSRYPIINSVQYHLPRPQDSADRRSIVIADILLPSGKVIRVAATHIDHMGGWEEQFSFIGKLKEMKEDIPLLLIGDMNDAYVNDIYQYLGNNLETLHKGGLLGIDYIIGNKGRWQKISSKDYPRVYKGAELSDLHEPIEVIVKCVK